MDDRRKKSKKKYGWLSGASEKEVQEHIDKKGDYGKRYDDFLKGFSGESDKPKDPKKKKKKRSWNFFD